jgi:thiol-disulfide isomerase/thioredoxin
MKLRILGSILIIFVVFSGIASAGAVPDGFRLEPVVSGLTDPSSLAMTADGSILITERTTGDVRLIRHGELLASPVCSVAVEVSGEAGLLGVAPHPGFLQNGWFYLYYTASGSVNKVTRYTLQGSTCGGATDIVTLDVGASTLRNGGGIAFGPDGSLYVATGDFEGAVEAQNDSSLAGKVLRMNDDGSVPEDNPTPGSLVFAKGLCNGQGLAVDDDGNVFVTDAGSDSSSTYDELNTVPFGGNLGWNEATGDSNGLYDDPLAEWLPVLGVRGLAWYGAQVFPDAAADGHDNDEDRFGADRNPGIARTDDDGNGTCVGSNNNEQPCTSNANCPPRVVIFTENSFCEFRDEADEYCPSGTGFGDDGCGASGIHGIDEADESFVNSLFFAAIDDGSVYRAVREPGDLSQLRQTERFIDSSFLTGCPSGWTDTMAGRDGFLYALATNGGGSAGALYRVVHDDDPGPREVSRPGSHFPLRVDRGAGSDVQIFWEDLRSDALQPRDDGNADPTLRQPLQPEREYTIWQGTLGDWSSHVPVSGFDDVPGTAVNEAVRETTFNAGGGDSYFLVSARHANLEGSLGSRSDGSPRVGYATTDLCDTLGYHGSANDWALWLCGQDFSLRDEHGETRSLYEFREQVVMLDLSAIWCPPCQSEADQLETVYQEYKERGVRFLTVLMDEDNQLVDYADRPVPAECRNWSDRSGSFPDHTFPCWVDPNDGSKDAWPKYNKFGALPTNVVLDTGLRVVYSGAGYDEATIKNKLDRLVGTTDQCVH